MYKSFSATPSKQIQYGGCLQKITERNLCASEINFHSLSTDVWAEKPDKYPWMLESSSAWESAGKQSATNSWAGEGASPGRGSRRRRCCSAQLQWGTDYPHLRAGRVWNGNEEEISLPQYPAATADAALRQQGSRQHAAGTFVSPLFSSSQSPPLIVTQKVSYRNGTRAKNYIYLHILTLILRSLCVWRLQFVYSKQNKLAALYTSLILLGLETKHRLWCHAKGSGARNSKSVWAAGSTQLHRVPEPQKGLGWKGPWRCPHSTPQDVSENSSGRSIYSTQNSYEEIKPTFTDVLQISPNSSKLPNAELPDKDQRKHLTNFCLYPKVWFVLSSSFITSWGFFFPSF